MLIVCPSCATSYMINPAAVAPSGRMVRCARCKTAWHAGGPKAQPDVAAYVDDVIAEVEAQAPPHRRSRTGIPPQAAHTQEPPPSGTEPETARPDDDFSGGEEQRSDEIQASSPPAGDTPQPEESIPAEQQPAADAGLPAPAADEPVAVTDAPSLVPPMEHEPLPEPGQAEADAELDAEDIESFAARRARMQTMRQKKRRTSQWTAVILLLFGFNVALIGARSEIVRYLPQTASLFSAIGLPVNLRNLTFDNVKISKEMHDGVSVLVVEGTISSTAGKAVEVPRLRFAVRNSTGQEIYTWTALPVRTILGAGETQPFRSRLASPPADANDVLVRFVTDKDAATGAK